MATFTPTTWDPEKKGSYVTLSNGNKTAQTASGAARSIFGATSGTWYFEFGAFASGSEQCVGIASDLFDVEGVPGLSTSTPPNSWSIYRASGQIFAGGVELGTVASGGTTLGVLLDVDAKTMRFRRDGVVVGPEISLVGERFFAAFGQGSRCTINCGASAFAHSAPAGYFAGFGVRAFAIAGNVKDDAGANAARVVRAYRRDTGGLVGSAISDGGTGNYTLNTDYAGEHTLVFLDDDAGTAYNALVLDRVTGV